MADLRKIEIFTYNLIDSSLGVWSAYLKCDIKETKVVFAGGPNSTGYHLELTAVVKSLQMLRAKADVHLFTGRKDIAYGFRDLNLWKENGWKNSNEYALEDIQLWKELDAVSRVHRIEIEYLPSDCYWREVCLVEALARKKIAELKAR